MKIISKFNGWKHINEQEQLNIDSKKSSETKRTERKQNKRKFRKEDYISDSGSTYSLIKQKSSNKTKDTFVLKGKGKDSPVWNKEGEIVNDVNDFLNFELFSGKNKGKYNEDSIKMEKYREGMLRDRVKFTIDLATSKPAVEPAQAVSKPAVEPAQAVDKIQIPENEEGENRIEIGQTSEVLPKIKEVIRKSFVPKGFKLGEGFGVDWLDSTKLEEKDAVWVRALRAGFGMKIANFISQGLINKLIDQVLEWENEKKSEDTEVASNESLIPMFNLYLKLMEAFDMEAAQKEMEAPQKEMEAPQQEKETSISNMEKMPLRQSSSPSTWFTQDEGDRFRKWANSTDELKRKYGKDSEYDLDPTGKPDNSFIRKAYAAAKKEYGAFIKQEGKYAKRGTTVTSENQKSLEADYLRASNISTALINFWKSVSKGTEPGTSTFKDYKGRWDDDELKGLKFGYEPWLEKNGIVRTLSLIKDPVYKKTMEDVVFKTKEEMTDIIGNTVTWTLFNPKGLEEELSDADLQAALEKNTAIIKLDPRYSKSTPDKTLYSIPGGQFDF
jgi:hypothetical protein